MLRRRPLVLVLTAAAALAAAGCGAAGGHSDSRPDQDASLLLDSAPRPVHAGLYLALQRGYDDAEGVHLRVQQALRPAAAAKALVGGQADLAIMDIHDLARARQRGRDVVGVMAVVQTPLASVLDRRRDLRGRVDLARAPTYPELVLATSRETLETNGPVVRAAVRALRRGYEAAIDDPASAVTALTDADPDLRRTQVAAGLDDVSPSFTAGARFFGELDPRRLAAWAGWERRTGLVARPPDAARAFDPATAATGRTGDPDA